MTTIKQVRNILRPKVGSMVIIIYYGSRNKSEKYVGVLLKLYYNVFTIKLIDGNIKCFNYIDVLTKTIQICM